MKLLIVFIGLSVVNVIFSTIRSITTIKSGKTIASIISGGYYAFYNVMLIYTVMDFPLWQKCIITFVCNVLGVYTVKFIEEKMRKDRLWEIRVTCQNNDTKEIHNSLVANDIPHNYIENVGKHTVFNIYCETQAQSQIVNGIIKENNCKYFISESKVF